MDKLEAIANTELLPLSGEVHEVTASVPGHDEEEVELDCYELTAPFYPSVHLFESRRFALLLTTEIYVHRHALFYLLPNREQPLHFFDVPADIDPEDLARYFDALKVHSGNWAQQIDPIVDQQLFRRQKLAEQQKQSNMWRRLAEWFKREDPMKMPLDEVERTNMETHTCIMHLVGAGIEHLETLQTREDVVDHEADIEVVLDYLNIIRTQHETLARIALENQKFT